MKTKERGITLIALVITIIVLLILVAVSIATLTGENGILTRTTESKEQTEIAKKEEEVRLAISELIIDNNGNKVNIKPQDIVDKLNKDANRGITAIPTDTLPTTIKFPASDTTINKDIEVKVNEDLNIESSSSNVGTTGDGGTTGGSGNTEETSIDGMYSVGGLTKDDITPQDIFEYEIISKGTVASTTQLSDLPIATARIKQIKTEYCSSEDTNYEVIYNGEKINELVIPYEVKIGDDMYKITEVNIMANDGMFAGFPNIEKAIYPNTVKTIYGGYVGDATKETTIREVILSNSLNEIGDNSFYSCTLLENIIIPESVTRIGYKAFSECTSLENITIPESVTSIDDSAFFSWSSSLRNINIKKPEESILGAPWGAPSATVNWNYTGE